MPANLPFEASAVLLWLAPNASPTDEDFNPANVTPPPAQNPLPYWFLHEAVVDAIEADRLHGKIPWIKFGTEILNEEAIKRLYCDAKKLTG